MSRALAAVLGAMSEPDGQSARLRFGVVTSINPLRVDVGAGGVGLPVANGSPVALTTGSRVWMLQQGKQMMVGGVYVPSE